jgi:putative antitoxin of VapBC-like toxin-antitoxin system
MKTTLNLDQELLRRARERAAERGTTLTAVIEGALRAALSAPQSQQDFRLSFPTMTGSQPPVVDPAERDALHDRMATSE